MMNARFGKSQRDFIHQPRVGEPASLPWVTPLFIPQPQRGCIITATERCNPVGVVNDSNSPTQGSRCAPTLGCMMLPRWGKTHARMVKLVETMLELHRQLTAARTPQEQTSLERQIAATDT